MRIDTYYLNIAQAASERSKCVSKKVGCVLVMNDKIASTGLNGTRKGTPNCCDVFPEGNCPEHRAWSLENEIHAEMNAIFQAERDLAGAWAFITHSPCGNCLKHLRGAGVTRIYFRDYWRTSDEELLKIKQCDILFKEGEDNFLN